MKKLYWQLSDNGDVSKVVMDLSGAFEWIKNDDCIDESSNVEYTLTPIWMTDEEYEALPEANL